MIFLIEILLDWYAAGSDGQAADSVLLLRLLRCRGDERRYG
jgi:hypothetical protein